MLKDIKAVIFDFDGTLAGVDLDFDLMRARVLELAGARGLCRESIQVLKGLPVLETMRAVMRMLESMGRDGEEFRGATMGMIEEMEVEAASRGSLFPYSRPCLELLVRESIKVGVITRNCRRAVLTVFPDMADYAGVFLSRDDVPQVKPHPDHVLKALELLEVEACHSIMVGDHPLDVETGHRAGMQTAGVATGRISLGDLCAAGADMAAPDCEMLVRSLLADQARQHHGCS